MSRRSFTEAERRSVFLAKTRVCAETDCWLWTASLSHDGYGRAWNGARVLYATRLAYELFAGPIPSDRELHHECETKSCVNPSHLTLVTRSEHQILHRRRSHCANGHLYDGANTYWRPNGRRDCRACIRERQAQSKKRRQKAVAA